MYMIRSRGILEISKKMKQRLLHRRMKELCAKQLFNYLALCSTMSYNDLYTVLINPKSAQ